MEITGKVTADATVKTLESGKQVVNFNIVDNEYYIPKGSTERKQVATYFNCAYWISPNVAKVLRKGATVQLTGRVSARAYTTNTGDTGASLVFNTNRIKVLAYAKQQQGKDNGAPQEQHSVAETKDDLPF